TLESLRAEHGLSRPLILLLGSDAFAGITAWKDWRRLPVLAHLAVLARPGWRVQVPAGLPVRRVSDPAALIEAPAGALYCLQNAPVPLSATAVRAALAAGDELSDRVPAEVLAYIENHQL